jgi:hypothetical protein
MKSSWLTLTRGDEIEGVLPVITIKTMMDGLGGRQCATAGRRRRRRAKRDG